MCTHTDTMVITKAYFSPLIKESTLSTYKSASVVILTGPFKPTSILQHILSFMLRPHNTLFEALLFCMLWRFSHQTAALCIAVVGDSWRALLHLYISANYCLYLYGCGNPHKQHSDLEH
jgi:hypothetical protein